MAARLLQSRVWRCVGLGAMAAIGPSLKAQPGELVIWGTSDPLLLNAPAGNYLAADAGANFGVGIREDRTLTAWGYNFAGQLNVPSGTFLQVSAGQEYAVGIRTDGTLAAWGDATWGLTNPPSGSFLKVDASARRATGLRTDGTLVEWGAAGPLEPPPSGQFIDIATGENFGLALRADGTLAVWDGDPITGILNVPTGQFVAVAAGARFGAALRADGTVALWGSTFGNPALITGNVRQISASGFNLLAIRDDGTLTSSTQLSLPPGSFGAVSTGFLLSMAIVPSPSAATSALVAGFVLIRRRRTL